MTEMFLQNQNMEPKPRNNFLLALQKLRTETQSFKNSIFQSNLEDLNRNAESNQSKDAKAEPANQRRDQTSSVNQSKCLRVDRTTTSGAETESFTWGI